MVSEIAPLHEDGCLGRGISIMRLALGYEKGLPDGWKLFSHTRTQYTVKDEILAVANAFPEHTVRIICAKGLAEAVGLRRDQYIEAFYANPKKVANNFMFGFAYTTHIINLYMINHFIVANPTNEMASYTIYTVMVSTERKKK